MTGVIAAKQGTEIASKALSVVHEQLSKPIIGWSTTTVRQSRNKTVTKTSQFAVSGWQVLGTGMAVVVSNWMGFWHWKKWGFPQKDGTVWIVSLPAAGPPDNPWRLPWHL